ncbi:hypothetical protein SI859A1_01313 [Aurantimonas manganoxydans SI85-9A1]|uniref:Uncharacterized protein n=1 Tax=Aurantimonas manganoxydans (strain ATCC BAA-1229 / DSM 21871 / SI85-9A1) TaxID=287752 RepID=Q1YJ07_AURMS|nr:hypothetical protein SI859A1_01313 [Aurantimonas manganoxydans SI85-9A1]
MPHDRPARALGGLARRYGTEGAACPTGPALPGRDIRRLRRSRCRRTGDDSRRHGPPLHLQRWQGTGLLRDAPDGRDGLARSGCRRRRENVRHPAGVNDRRSRSQPAGKGARAPGLATASHGLSPRRWHRPLSISALTRSRPSKSFPRFRENGGCAGPVQTDVPKPENSGTLIETAIG